MADILRADSTSGIVEKWLDMGDGSWALILNDADGDTDVTDILRADPTTGIIERWRDMGNGSWAKVVSSSASGGSHPGYVAGNRYHLSASNIAGGSAMTANSIRMIPFSLTKPLTLTALEGRVSTADAAGLFQLAIYNNRTGSNLPGTLACNTGDMSGAAATIVQAVIAQTSVTLQPGMYWMAANCNSATLIMTANAAADALGMYLAGSTSSIAGWSSATNAQCTWTFAQAFGTWPDLTAQTIAVATNATHARIVALAA